MKRLSTLLAAVAIAAPMSLLGCADDSDIFEGEQIKDDNGKEDASVVATFIEISWSGSFLTDYAYDLDQTIEDHLLYTIGQLNGYNSVGRLDHLKLLNVTKTTEGGRTKISYDATLPVAWGKKNAVPTTLQLKLPLDMGNTFITAFTEKFKHSCVDYGAHDVDSGSMWYYFRPAQSGCALGAADVNTYTASVSPSPQQTTGKFPEYHKIWEDNQYNTVAIFGKYEDGATSGSDAGIAAWNEFYNGAKRSLAAYGTVTTVPASIPANPGTAVTDIEMSVTRADGKKINVTMLLSDNVRVGLQNPAFRTRYENASTRADVITYNGHAGLGANIRALSRAGKWVRGQYVISFENGCDTFAYIDDEMRKAHQAVNPDDTTGFKYLDTLANAMPAFFANMSEANVALMNGLMDTENPQTYEQIFRNIHSSQVVLVTGEQDNTFVPGAVPPPPPGTWAGINETATLAKGATKKYTTPALAAGDYTFDITGTGDADLYVRIGSAPTMTKFDCRPYKNGSNESCKVTLPAATTIGVMVRGYATSSKFTIVGKKS